MSGSGRISNSISGRILAFGRRVRRWNIIGFLFLLTGLLLTAVVLPFPWWAVPVTAAVALVALRALATPSSSSAVVRERESA